MIQAVLKVVILVLSLACLASKADEDGMARLLASKSILNQKIVEGKDLTIEYSIYNVGGSAALNVKLTDTFPQPDFEVVRGFSEVQWERIAPGSNVTHVIVLKPTLPGIFNFSSAEISYLPGDDIKEAVFGYTSGPGHKDIIPSKEYDRRFSPHMLDWAAFAVMTLPSLGIPCMLWYSSMSKYSQTKPKKN